MEDRRTLEAILIVAFILVAALSLSAAAQTGPNAGSTTEGVDGENELRGVSIGTDAIEAEEYDLVTKFKIFATSIANPKVLTNHERGIIASLDDVANLYSDLDLQSYLSRGGARLAVIRNGSVYPVKVTSDICAPEDYKCVINAVKETDDLWGEGHGGDVVVMIAGSGDDSPLGMAGREYIWKKD